MHLIHFYSCQHINTSFSELDLYYFLDVVSKIINDCVSMKLTSCILELKCNVEKIQHFDDIYQ